MDGGKVCPARWPRCGGGRLNMEGWMGPVVVVAGADAPELPWLRQRKFLKVMNLAAMQALHAVHEAHGAAAGLAGKHSAVAVSVEEVDSGLRDWQESSSLASQKWGTDQPEFAQIGNCLPPLGLIPRLPNSIAGHISREFQLKGPVWTAGGASGYGIGSILMGLRWLADGVCESMVAVHVGREGTMGAMLSLRPAEGFRKIEGMPKDQVEAKSRNYVLMQSVHDWKELPSGCTLDGGVEFASCLRLHS